jgi:DNA-binding NarL/FixJ family response regulator
MGNSNENHNLCQSCNKRDLCKVLCPEAELFVNQDERDWGETPTTYIDPDNQELRVFDPVKNTDISFLTAREKGILDGISEGKSRAQIAKNLGISMSTLRSHIQNMREKASRL